MTRLSTLAPLGLGLALLLSACSAGGTTSAAGSSAPAAAASGAPTPARTPGARTVPGVSGTIAYVSGQLMQVQDTSTQTAVAWTASTTFTSDEPGTLADVVPGTCVVATTAVPRTTGTSTAAPTAEPSASGAATRVAITDAVDGACTAGGFPGGGFPAGAAGGLPSGAPTALPGDGAPQGVPTARPSGGAFGNGGRAFGGRTAGLVTAVAGTTISVRATGAGGATTAETVTVDAATTYTRAVKAAASAVVVGQCATAIGPADSSGKITATSVTVSAPVNGTCTSFGVGRGGTGLAGARNGGRTGGAGSTTGTAGGSHA